jgi:hypothetical protein
MKPSHAWLGLVVAGVLTATSPAFTHHSNALVDKDTLYTLTGVVTKFAFVNPHVAIYWKGLNTKGETVEWYASAAGPRAYAALGWNNKTFKPGDKILVQGHPMRDGSPLMQFQSIYQCSTGIGAKTDAGNLDEYRTRLKIVTLPAERVKELCVETNAKVLTGEIVD